MISDLPIFVMKPMNCEILAQKVAAATPSSRKMLVEFSDALVIDANDRVQKAFAELGR